VAFYPVLLLPVLLVVGILPLSHTPLLVLAMLVLMLIGGMHLVLVSIVGMLYPTAVRGSGSGWASSIGKVGGVFGPILGGMVLSSGLPAARSYLFLAVCPAIVFACAIPIAILYRRANAKHGTA
jgi:AAHS family 4-hydroxybenzoate transporter-like MFS transporter